MNCFNPATRRECVLVAKEIIILYGFKYTKGENEITKAIESYGIAVNSAMRYSKASIKGFLESEKGRVDVAVLKEYLEGGEEYSPEELAHLADDTGTRFIVLLHPKNRGRDAMKTVYIAGILDAVFADKKMGASPETIATLVLKGRTRAEARDYYRIYDLKWPTYNILTLEQYTDALRFLEGHAGGDELDIAERFNELSYAFTKQQFVLFINKLPDDDLRELKQYELFYVLIDSLHKGGYTDMRYRMPKDVIKMLPKDSAERARAKFAREENLRRNKPAPVLQSVQINELDGTMYQPGEEGYGQVERSGRSPSRPMGGRAPMQMNGQTSGQRMPQAQTPVPPTPSSSLSSSSPSPSQGQQAYSEPSVHFATHKDMVRDMDAVSAQAPAPARRGRRGTPAVPAYENSTLEQSELSDGAPAPQEETIIVNRTSAPAPVPERRALQTGSPSAFAPARSAAEPARPVRRRNLSEHTDNSRPAPAGEDIVVKREPKPVSSTPVSSASPKNEGGNLSSMSVDDLISQYQ